MQNTAVYPGTFDPVTFGHLDLISRSAEIFDQVVVAVASRSSKSGGMFAVDARLAMVRESAAHLPNVVVETLDGLLVDYLKRLRNPVVLRGLRVVSDFEYEFQMALMNRKLDPNFEVLYLMPDERYSYISSSLVREVARLGGKVDQFVPKEVARRVHETMRLKGAGA